MKRIFFLLVWLFAATTEAGEIFGAITEEGTSVGAGVGVEIVAPSKTYMVQTNEEGSYRVHVKEAGKCTLTVRYHGTAPTIEVTSQEERSVRYDLLLVKEKNTYSLQRK